MMVLPSGLSLAIENFRILVVSGLSCKLVPSTLSITTISLMIYTKSEPFYDFGLLKDTREDRGAAYDYIKAWST
jgi:hypothetical protein